MTSSTADAPTGDDVKDFFAGSTDADTDTEAVAVDESLDTSSDDDDDEPLGPKGTKALDAEKAKRRAEADRRRAAEAKVRELQAKLDGGGDSVEDAALSKANARILRSEVRAAAAGKLHDPKDALVHLDLDAFEVDDDGTVDEDELAEAIADLLEKKPYLAAQGGTKAPRPDRSQGARGVGAASTAAQFAAATENLLN